MGKVASDLQIKDEGYKNFADKKNEPLAKERNTGIEPASQAWEARALPMC